MNQSLNNHRLSINGIRLSTKRMFRVTAFLLFVAAVLQSCNFLERQPWDSVDTTNGFQTAADAEAAVNACYQPLQWLNSITCASGRWISLPAKVW